jgi:hypothetical protein
MDWTYLSDPHYYKCLQQIVGLLGWNTAGFCPGFKRPEREVNHSPSYSAEFKNAWKFTSSSPMRLLGVLIT